MYKRPHFIQTGNTEAASIKVIVCLLLRLYLFICLPSPHWMTTGCPFLCMGGLVSPHPVPSSRGLPGTSSSRQLLLFQDTTKINILNYKLCIVVFGYFNNRIYWRCHLAQVYYSSSMQVHIQHSKTDVFATDNLLIPQLLEKKISEV